MGFWFTVVILMLIYLVIKLMIKVKEENRATKERAEMPGKVAVITGASTILGRALAQTFYRAGCKVILVGPNEDELEQIRAHLFSLRPKDVPVYQPECVAISFINETSYDIVQEKAATILEQCGQVDYLIHNSTICTRSDILSSTLETDIRVMNVNYFGPVALTKALLPSMVHRKSGKIIFVSSVAGKVPIPFRSAFAASKHSLQAFADALRAEVAMYHVKVLVSSPEYIAMDLTDDDICTAGSVHETQEKGVTTLGEPPQKIADQLLLAVLRDYKEDCTVSFQIAYWLRATCPSLYHFMMARRAEQTVTASIPKAPERY